MGAFLALLGFVLLMGLIFYLQRIHVKYPKRIFTGLALGIIFGGLLQAVFGAESQQVQTIIPWLDIVGLGYVRLLQMLVVPIIFVSLVRAFTEIEGESNLGRIGLNVLAILIVTVSIASAVGIATTLLFNLDGAQFVRGAEETARIAALQESQAQIADLTLPEQILSFIPTNIFEDLAGARSTSTLSVVIFSAILGTAYLGVARKKPEEAEVFKKIINSLHALVMRMVTLILRLAPFGIMALMTKMVASSSIQVLINMGTFLVASYFAYIVMFIIHLMILILFKVNPIDYVKKAWNVLSFAFTSRSSAGALPLNISTQTEAMGVDSTTANFSATFGLSIGQNACAGIYPTMLVAIIAPNVGMDLSNPWTWLTIIATVAVSSFGVAGVGGGATFASLIVFGTLGLPIEIIGLMVSIEPIVDMGRTMINVNDSILAGVVTSSRLKTLDRSVLSNPNYQVTPEMDMN